VIAQTSMLLLGGGLASSLTHDGVLQRLKKVNVMSGLFLLLAVVFFILYIVESDSLFDRLERMGIPAYSFYIDILAGGVIIITALCNALLLTLTWADLVMALVVHVRHQEVDVIPNLDWTPLSELQTRKRRDSTTSPLPLAVTYKKPSAPKLEVVNELVPLFYPQRQRLNAKVNPSGNFTNHDGRQY
jgi:hypothetical protein